VSAQQEGASYKTMNKNTRRKKTKLENRYRKRLNRDVSCCKNAQKRPKTTKNASTIDF